MMIRKGKSFLGALTAAALLTLGAGSAQAASNCKGLEKNPCESNASCSWVSGFTRKDGVKVSAHCRKKGGKKGASSGTKKSSDKKS